LDYTIFTKEINWKCWYWATPSSRNYG